MPPPCGGGGIINVRSCRLHTRYHRLAPSSVCAAARSVYSNVAQKTDPVFFVCSRSVREICRVVFVGKVSEGDEIEWSYHISTQ